MVTFELWEIEGLYGARCPYFAGQMLLSFYVCITSLYRHSPCRTEGRTIRHSSCNVECFYSAVAWTFYLPNPYNMPATMIPFDAVVAAPAVEPIKHINKDEQVSSNSPVRDRLLTVQQRGWHCNVMLGTNEQGTDARKATVENVELPTRKRKRHHSEERRRTPQRPSYPSREDAEAADPEIARVSSTSKIGAEPADTHKSKAADAASQSQFELPLVPPLQPSANPDVPELPLFLVRFAESIDSVNVRLSADLVEFGLLM